MRSSVRYKLWASLISNKKHSTWLGVFLIYQCCPKSQITLIFLVAFIKIVAIAFSMTTSTNTLNHTILSNFLRNKCINYFSNNLHTNIFFVNYLSGNGGLSFPIFFKKTFASFSSFLLEVFLAKSIIFLVNSSSLKEFIKRSCLRIVPKSRL